MFLFHHCFYYTILKTFSLHHMVLVIKTQAEMKTHIQKWRKFARFAARPSREWIVLKDTSKLFTEMLRCSVRNATRPSREWIVLKDTWKLPTEMMRCSARSASKNLIEKISWRGINKNVVFAVCVVSTSQTPLI